MLVSLLISTYNWKEALALCVRSVLRQTVRPAEIVIADDGSRDDTRATIDALRRETDIPIVHVWQEDRGFRLSEIRNKAIMRASSPYIIQVDGDVILEKHFIADHIEMAETGYFVCGSRVGLTPKVTARLLQMEIKSEPRFYQLPIGYMLNSFRSRRLRNYLAKRFAPEDVTRLRGCNMAFWKEDLLRVNGYNEDLTMWGQEDNEIAYRLIFSGVKKKYLKAGGVEYHLYHKAASKANLEYHARVVEEAVSERRTWCTNGIVKGEMRK